MTSHFLQISPHAIAQQHTIKLIHKLANKQENSKLRKITWLDHQQNKQTCLKLLEKYMYLCLYDDGGSFELKEKEHKRQKKNVIFIFIILLSSYEILYDVEKQKNSNVGRQKASRIYVSINWFYRVVLEPAKNIIY